MLQAQVIKGKLEAFGVPVFLKYEAIGQVIGLTVDGLGLVQVQVPAERAAEAQAVLAGPVERELDEGAAEDDWTDEEEEDDPEF
jgi:hypothetical protein